MQKIKDKVIQKIYRTDLSNIEQLCLYQLLFRSNEKGFVPGVYYKEIVNSINCSYAQYYNVLSSLQEKGFILITKNPKHKSDVDVLIFDNDFSNEEVYTNYTDLNINFFFSTEFVSLKAGAKRVALYLIFRIKKQKYELFGVSNKDKNRLFYKKYSSMANELRMTERMVKIYCASLKKMKIISIGEKVTDKRYDIITFSNKFLKAPEELITSKKQINNRSVFAKFFYYKHFVKNLCRYFKINYDYININDTTVLINQYMRLANKSNKDIFIILENALSHFSNTVLSSKNIHRVVKNLLNRDYSSDLLFY